MKKIITRIIYVILLMTFVPMMLKASEYIEPTELEEKGFCYTVSTSMIDNKKIAVITKYEGNATTLHFPNILGGYPVSSVDLGSFSGNTTLNKIIFPESLTGIGEWAFINCISLKNVTLSSKTTKICEAAFENCTSLTTVSVTPSNSEKNAITSYSPSIDRLAFQNCTSLSSVTIPENIACISVAAFSGCTSLPRITIPKSVKKIQGGAFSNCTSLSRVTIPNNETKISKDAFENCSKKLTIYCNKGSVVQKYATKNKIRWSAGFSGGVIKLTFNASKGKIAKKSKVTIKNTYGKKIKLAKNPKRKGYKFKGWYTKKAGGKKITKRTKIPSANKTYYARWSKGRS